MNEIASLLGGLSPQAFLDGYWQKRPLLVRGALPGFHSPLSPEELAGLACEDGVEARLILEQGGRHPWELRHGPFAESTFTQLPASHWTVLVQDVDKYVDAVAELLEHFRFIPSWRIDDVMVSYAAPHASVGAHVDSYDVFLIQGLGRRRWQISSLPASDQDLAAEGDVRRLAHFEPAQTWVLEPGDMLYLPPGLPHHGVALDPCMTYSVGFRAPSHRELVTDVLDRLAEAIPDAPRYGDPGLRASERPGEIPAEALGRLRETLHSYLAVADARLAEWVGRMVTDPKPNLQPQPPAQALSLGGLEEQLQAGRRLHRAPTSRFAYVAEGAGRIRLFADGEAYALHADSVLAALICDQGVVGADDLDRGSRQRELTCLAALYNQGSLLFDDE